MVFAIKQQNNGIQIEDGREKLGTLNQPASGSVALTVRRFGHLFRMDFTLKAARITVTDAGVSGSSGSFKLFDFDQNAIVFHGCRQNYTAFAEGAALTGGAGDAAFVLGLGSVAANAGDLSLTATEVNVGSVTPTITLSGGTGTGTQVNSSTSALNGTSTAVDLYLNFSGSAATIDANSTLDITGTITVIGALLGGD